MKFPLPLTAAFALLAAVSASAQIATLPNVTLKPSEVINLWPGAAPDETGNPGPERILTDRPRPFDQITDVSVPTLAVFQPAQRTGTGVLVIPGGGLERLAIETEGYEIAQWLNDHGMAAFLLKYRVPPRRGQPRWRAGLQDAQRAMGLIRARAREWQIDPDALGCIGFSAGAEINVMLSVYHADARQYPPVDAADQLSTRPDFNIALYGGGFANIATNTLRDDIAARLNAHTPPMFIAHAFDDQALSSLVLMSALKRANIASEVHIFGAGAHGFGARDTGLPVGHWRDLCLNWLAWQGFLDPAGVRAFAREFLAATIDPTKQPRFTAINPAGDLDQAFAAQRRIVRDALAHGGEIAGYMGAFTTAAAQSAGGLKAPVHGVLFKAGRLDASAAGAPTIKAHPRLLVATGIGYVIATDIGTKLLVPRQALTTVEAIVPVIELPNNPDALHDGERAMNPLDAVAANLGSNQFIVGAAVAPKKIENLDALPVTLKRDGRSLNATTGADVAGGQARNLMALINQIVEQGRVLHRGDIIISGALGGAQPGERGSYAADFGALGKIDFKVE